MRRILVIGSKGMLGRDLCARLRQDFEVIEADIDEVDITDFGATRELVAGLSPDEVVNVAAFTDVDGAESKAWLAYEINAEGARNVAKAAAAVGSRCTYIGTDFIFDGKKGSPYVEDDAPNPQGVYAKSKLAGELNVQKHANRHLIVRTAWLFGMHGKNFVEAILRRAQSVGLLRKIMKMGQEPISQQTPINEVEHGDVGDLIREALRRFLTPREEMVIRRRFGIDRGHKQTLEETGIMFNVTRERIRQIEAKALRKLRHPTRRGLFKGLSLDLRVVDDQIGSPTYSVDLSEAIARLLMTEETGVFHCAGSGSCSWFDFARAIVETAGMRDVDVSPISSADLDRPAPRPPYSVLDTSKLYRAIGFRMPTWEDALRRYLRLRNERIGE